MSSSSYKFGRVLGGMSAQAKLGGALVALATGAVIALGGRSAYEQGEAEHQQSVAASAAAAKAHQEELRSKQAAARLKMKEDCQKDEPALLARAKASIASGHPEAQLMALRHCADVNSGSEPVQKMLERSVAAQEKMIAVAAARERAADDARRRKEGVSIGMTREEVLKSNWGRPEHINRTSTATMESEQWVYPDGAGYLYFEHGVLTAVQH